MLKNKFLILLSGLLLMGLTQFAYADQDATLKSLKIDLLYVQVAPSATLSKVCNKTGVCQEKLTLEHLPKYLLTFNNGKPRVGGNILNERFVKQYYSKSGASSKLNTALLAFENGKVQEHLITVSNPVYSPKTQEMTYDITFIKKLDPIESETTLSNVALFIDSVCAICVT